MEVPLKLLGIVAFIMFATYFSAAVIFDDSTAAFDEYSQEQRPSEDKYMLWLDVNYPIVRVFALDRDNWQTLINGDRGVLKTLTISDKHVRSLANCLSIWLDENYNVYPTDARDVYDTLPMNTQVCLLGAFNSYAWTGDYELTMDDLTGEISVRKVKKNLFDLAIDFIWQIPDGLDKIGEVFTFGFKDAYGNVAIPAVVRMILNIIFIPLWIVLAVGILPLIARFINAIGSIIPF